MCTDLHSTLKLLVIGHHSWVVLLHETLNVFLSLFSVTHPFLDAPKYANITGMSGDEYDAGVPIQLSCRSTSFPDVRLYKWYKKQNKKSNEEYVQAGQNLTVHPDHPGIYYCHASNSEGGKNSTSVRLFLNSQYSFLMLR